jgi:hypothetical protein
MQLAAAALVLLACASAAVLANPVVIAGTYTCSKVVRPGSAAGPRKAGGASKAARPAICIAETTADIDGTRQFYVTYADKTSAPALVEQLQREAARINELSDPSKFPATAKYFPKATYIGNDNKYAAYATPYYPTLKEHVKAHGKLTADHTTAFMHELGHLIGMSHTFKRSQDNAVWPVKPKHITMKPVGQPATSFMPMIGFDIMSVMAYDAPPPPAAVSKLAAKDATNIRRVLLATQGLEIVTPPVSATAQPLSSLPAFAKDMYSALANAETLSLQDLFLKPGWCKDPVGGKDTCKLFK